MRPSALCHGAVITTQVDWQLPVFGAVSRDTEMSWAARLARIPDNLLLRRRQSGLRGSLR